MKTRSYFNNPGVDAVIHLAMPVTAPLDAKGTIDVRHSLAPRWHLTFRPIQAAKAGTMNLIVQAYKAGVKRFSIGSSITACSADQTVNKTWTHEGTRPIVNILPDLPHNPYLERTDWNDTPEDEALTSTKGPLFVYSAAKALAEKLAWEFVKEHPEISLLARKHTVTFIGPLWN